MIEMPLTDHGLIIIANTPLIAAAMEKLRDGETPDDAGLTHTYLVNWITGAALQQLSRGRSPLQTAIRLWIAADMRERLAAAREIVELALAAGKAMREVRVGPTRAPQPNAIVTVYH